MNVPLLDLHAQYALIKEEIREAIDRVMESQRFILGPEVEALEKDIAAYTKSRDSIGVSSGSDALLMALMALEIGPGDEVITSPYTFFATVGAIARVGATPVFVDIDSHSMNIETKDLKRFVTKRTKALMPVHLFGQTAQMESLLSLSEEFGIPIIEDAAQAIGAEYQGRRAGSMGIMGCFSFFPSKNLGTIGDGGILTVQDEKMAEKLRILRSHGSKPKYFHRYVGGNFRLDAVHAAVVRVKLKYLDQWTEARRSNAEYYNQLFSDAGLEGTIALPWVRKGDRHIFNQYVIRAPKRDALQSHLKEKGIGSEVYYPLPMHLQECFKNLGHSRGDFPESEKASEDSLAIPIYPELTKAQQEYVVETIQSFYA